jgi:hypothetical protein
MSDANEVLPCILYEEKVKHGDYDMVKVEMALDDGTFHKRTLPRFSGDKGVLRVRPMSSSRRLRLG